MEFDFMNHPIAWLEWTGLHMSPWKIIGLTGALMFGGRWLVQFLASRKHGKPVIPRLFWYMSLVGSAMTLSLLRVLGRSRTRSGSSRTCSRPSPPPTACTWTSGTAAGTGTRPATEQPAPAPA